MISIVTACFLIVLNVILKKITPEKSTKIFWSFFSIILAIFVMVFVMSMQIGGWTGLGYGMLSIFILFGMFITSIILLFMHVFSKDS